MKALRGILIAAGVVILLLTAYAWWEQGRSVPQGGSLIDQPAPSIRLARMVSGGLALPDTFQLSDFRGRWVVLNFWSSWCVECRREVPILNQFWKTLQEAQDSMVVVLGVNVWDKPTPARRFIETFRLSFPSGVDLTRTAGARYGLTGIPETFLIDPEGVIRDHIIGSVTPAWLEQVRERGHERKNLDHPAGGG